MTLPPSVFCHLLCLVLLRGISLLVPSRQREEWWREWRAELWHVRRACTVEDSFSWMAEREVATFCLGAFPDALCFREQFKRRPIPLATTVGSAMQCVQVLFGLIAISYGVALLLPDVSAILHFSAYRDTRNLMLLRDAHSSGDSVPTISAEQYKVWKQRRQELFNGFAFYQVVQQSISAESSVLTKGTVASASSNLFDLLGLRVRYSREAPGTLPRLILSEQMWKRRFSRKTWASPRGWDLLWRIFSRHMLAGVRVGTCLPRRRRAQPTTSSANLSPKEPGAPEMSFSLPFCWRAWRCRRRPRFRLESTGPVRGSFRGLRESAAGVFLDASWRFCFRSSTSCRWTWLICIVG